MAIIPNQALRQLRAGKLAIGLGVRNARTVDIAQMLRTCGFDWIFVDCEHSSMELDTAAQIAAASLTAFRDLIAALSATARQEPVSIAIGKILDQSGYLQDLRDERNEDAEGRIENLAELESSQEPVPLRYYRLEGY